MKQGPKLFLVDGHSLCYRAYYAITSLSNSKGEPTNAIYGFLTMLNKMVKEEAPEYLAVCFDRPEPTFRHEKYKEYKSHRKPMPEDLIQQIEPIKNLCRAYRFAIFEKPGFEADDVIGTLARRAEKKGFDVFLVTGDKDAMQLVTDRVRIFNPHKETAVIGIPEVKKRFNGLGPEKVVDIMALMGDASDNVPGVPGIGEKTAVKLIDQFGSVEALIQNAERIGSKSQKALIQEHEKMLRLSKELVCIDTEVPLETDWDELKIKAPDQEKLIETFRRYEFRQFLKDQPELKPAAEEKRHYQVIDSSEALERFAKTLAGVSTFAFDTETTSPHPMAAELVGMSFSWKPREAYYVPVQQGGRSEGLSKEKVLKLLAPILENAEQKKYGQNIKYDWMVLKNQGVEIRGMAFDTMIASYLINPVKFNHNLDDISLEYLGIRKIPTESLIGSGAKQITMAEVPVKQVAEYACEDADCVFRLVPILSQKLKESGLEQLFEKVEMPLANVLAVMEMNGVSLDVKLLAQLSEEAGKELDRLTREIYDAAGEEFNINSPKQLADVLFVKLNLPVVRRTKTGFSTDVSVLEKLSETHELPKKLLEYREKTKLKSTYLDALPEMMLAKTRCVHTSYHQTVTATGRLSSSDPNLQNIPVKTEGGRLIRKAFVPRGKDRVIFAADYSQIELRILAHLSADPNFVKAFQEDRDIHKFTATLLYGVKEPDVTREMRNAAKTINFSIIYGKTAYGLSGDLGISISEADEFIQNYFRRYSVVKAYLDGQLELARKQGYLTTILGRRAYFPDIQSKNGQIRQFAERAAINAPIQGSAADLIKLAMIAVQNQLNRSGMQSLMIMQVHDELVFDAPQKELPALEALVKKEMEGAFQLNVPLRVDTFSGSSWYKN